MDSIGKIEELPLKAWFPFDTRTSPVFEMTYAYQAVAVMVTALTDASMVGLVAIFMANVCGQLDILNYKLTNLGCKDDDCRRIGSTPAVEKMYSIEEALIDCVRHHLKIIELVKIFLISS